MSTTQAAGHEQAFRHLGIKLMGGGPQKRARCPLHDDRVPSLSVNVKKGVWFCHAGCGHGHVGNLADRLGVLLPGRPFQAGSYQRKTNRCGGSKADIREQLRFAETLAHLDRPKAVMAMMEQFEIARATAYRRIDWVRGQARVVVQHGKRLGVRTAWVLRSLREALAARMKPASSPYHEKLRQVSQATIRREEKLVFLRSKLDALRRSMGFESCWKPHWGVRELEQEIRCAEFGLSLAA